MENDSSASHGVAVPKGGPESLRCRMRASEKSEGAGLISDVFPPILTSDFRATPKMQEERRKASVPILLLALPVGARSGRAGTETRPTSAQVAQRRNSSESHSPAGLRADS